MDLILLFKTLERDDWSSAKSRRADVGINGPCMLSNNFSMPHQSCTVVTIEKELRIRAESSTGPAHAQQLQL